MADEKPRETDGNHRFGGNNRFGGMVPDTPDLRDRPLFPPIGLPENIAYAQESDEFAERLAQLGETEPLATKPQIDGWRVPVLDQDPLESCVSCAISSVINYLESRRNGSNIEPSRLFIYYNARVLEGTQLDPNVGTGIRTAIKAIGRHGVCDEQVWPYDKYRTIWRPSQDAYAAAIYNDLTYHRIYRLSDRDGRYELDLTPVRRALSLNIPVICGFTAFKSFVTAPKGKVGLPTEEDFDHRFLGPDVSNQHDPARLDGLASFGHAAVITGYTEDSFRLVNSWGTGWGEAGQFELPAEYLASSVLAQDFWVINALNASTYGQ